MKKGIAILMALSIAFSSSILNINASEASSRASVTRTCQIPISDNYSRGGVTFQASSTLVITIRVNDSTGVITSHDAYLAVNWVAVTNPSIAYSGSLQNISVPTSLSSSGRTVTATAYYDIVGQTYLGLTSVSYPVSHSGSCS